MHTSAFRFLSPASNPASPSAPPFLNTEKETVHSDRGRDLQTSEPPSSDSALLIQKRQGGRCASCHAARAFCGSASDTYKAWDSRRLRPRLLKETLGGTLGPELHRPVSFSSVVCDSSQPHGLQQARLPCPSTPETYSNSCHPTISLSSLAVCRVCFAHLCRVPSIKLALTSLLTSSTKTFWGWLLPPFPLVRTASVPLTHPGLAFIKHMKTQAFPILPGKARHNAPFFLKKRIQICRPSKGTEHEDFELLLLSTQTTPSTPGYASSSNNPAAHYPHGCVPTLNSRCWHLLAS